MMPTTNTTDYLSALMGTFINLNDIDITQADTTLADRFPTQIAHVLDDDHQPTSPSPSNAAAPRGALSPAFTAPIRSVSRRTQSGMDTHPPHTLGESELVALDSPAHPFTPLDFANVMEDLLSDNFTIESEDQT